MARGKAGSSAHAIRRHDRRAINVRDRAYGHDLLIVHAAARRLVDLRKADLGLAFDGVEDLDADRDQAQPQIAFPVRTMLFGHDARPRRSTH
jgi:hypothetical protein